MVGTYDRNKAKREHKQVALEHLASEEELQSAINEVLEGYERRDGDWEEYSWSDFEQDMAAVDQTLQERYHDKFYARLLGYSNATDYRQMIRADKGSHYALVDPTEQDLHGRRSMEKMLSENSCPACLCEHDPSADCPADEETRRFKESQGDPHDDVGMYHHDW